jgi:ATP-dependent RNA helicase DeaD
MDNNGFANCGVSQEIVKALENLGFETLTEVQQQVIPLALVDTDVIVRSQTGSGKTAAFAIPICEKIEVEERYPQALILTPTRELAVQLKQDIANIGRFKKIRCAAVFGRQPMELQKRELRQRVHVIVGTPGRTFDHMERKNVTLDEIKYLIIDEADKMLDMGFIDQVEAIIKMLPANRVTMVFSATMPDKIQEICSQYMSNPVTIEVDAEMSTAETIQQTYYEVHDSEKFNMVRKIIYTERPDSCLVFCNTRESVETVLANMQREGYHCKSLHGGMEQRERLQAMQSFKRGEFPILIATDVAARGIHVDGIALVINYDMPLDNESYVHRIGRTGRAGEEGRAITLVTPAEQSTLAELVAYIHYQIPRQETPTVEAVEQGKLLFTKTTAVPNYKSDKGDNLNRDITKIRINAGKKTKMRPGDILGAITSIPGVSAADTGIIDIQDTCSYVEILGGKGELVMEALLHTKIKGKVHTIKKINFHSM